MTVVPMPGADLERHQPSLELAQYVSADGLDQIQRALPEGVSLARFDQAFMTAALANPDLGKVDRTSLFVALVDAAKRGLMPDGKQGAIVPFKGKATFIPMIGGVRDTLAEHGWMLTASVVCANDRFEFDKAEARVSHRPVLTGERGPVIGAYALAKHRDGRQRAADYMTAEEIAALRDQMGVGGNPAWKKWPNQMSEKTVAHRLAKDLPLAPQDRRRVDWVINATELGPEESAAALYGPDAGASFAELPAGTQASPAAEGEPAEDVGRPSPTVDDPTRGSGVLTPGAAAAAIDDGEPVVVLEEKELPTDHTAEERAKAAAMFIPPNGQFAQGGDLGPKSLAEILALGEQGEKWLRWALGKVTSPQEYADAVWAFAAVYAPELHQQAAARKAA